MSEQTAAGSGANSGSTLSSTLGSTRLRWYALILLTSINLLNYIDRYIFSALLPAIKKDLGFSDTELGLLGSGFILAYLFIAPLFGFFGDRGGRSKLMAFGVTVWSAATAFSGICMTFTGQMLTRISVGVGESAYTVIAPSVITDYFPKASRGRIFAIYSGAIPVGSALGYILGGFLEPRWGWKHSFFVVGVPGILIAILLIFLKDPTRGQSEEASVQSGPALNLRDTYKSLLGNGGFLYTVLGYAAYTFVVGGMAFWMPMYIVRYFDISLEKGNLIFGGVTVVGGFIGTMLGGWWSDRIERKSGNGYLKVCFISMLFAVPLFAFTMQLHDFKHFAISLFFMEIALFLGMSPLDAACMSYVRPGLRATAMAVEVFLIHFLGDGISRALMGYISDSSDLRTAIAFLPSVLVLAAILWAVGVVFYWQPLVWPKKALSMSRFQSHRGFRPDAGVFENTLEAFRRARAAGAEMVECDVQLTADHEVVIFHDADLKRLAGVDKKLADVKFTELQSHFPAATRLSDLLIDPQSPPLVNIELKTAEVIGRSGLERAVVDVVLSANASERVVFSSFNPFALYRLSKIAPDIPRALLATEWKDKSNKFYLRKMLLGFIARPHILHLDAQMLSEKRIRAWRDRGMPLVAWTVNERVDADRLLGLGVQSVISDKVFR
jgi:MFS family permease/glycerophosphoryl diester phosphodiesterase